MALFLIGVLQHGMDLRHALETYTVLTIGDQLVDFALQQPELHQPGGDDPNRGFVRLVPVLVRSDFGECRFLRSQHQFVDRFLFSGKLAVDRPGAGDVGGVAGVFRAGIHEQQLARVVHERLVQRA